MSASAGSTPLDVVVAVVTYRRPAELHRLLRSLARLEPVPDAHVSVVVVDNDAGHSAASVVEEEAPLLPFPLRYVGEERPGVAHVRNAALRSAAQADAVAFVEDRKST